MRPTLVGPPRCAGPVTFADVMAMDGLEFDICRMRRGGFDTDEIARTFVIPEAVIDRVLWREREIRREQAALAAAALPEG